MRSPQRAFTLLALVAIGAAATVATASAQPGQSGGQRSGQRWQAKLDRHLRQVAESDQPQGQSVIVRIRPGAEERVQSELRRRRSRLGSRFNLSLVAGITTTLSGRELKDLAENPDVEGISLDAVVTAQQSSSDACWTWTSDSFNDPCSQPSSQYHTLRGALGYRSSNWDGNNVGVAVIDSGIALGSEGNVTAFYDFTNGYAQSRSPIDGYGHGSHVAGLIASSGSRSAGYYQGVAPGARLIGLRVLNSVGQGLTSNVIMAIEFATANKAALGIDVINLSLGHPIYEAAANDPLVLAVESAVRAGIVVVVSAGNMGINPVTGVVGYGGVSSPGNAPSAITVGAVDIKATANRSDDVVAAYSSRGPSWFDGYAKPDVVAPGHRLVAPVPSTATLSVTYPLQRVVAPGLSPSSHLRLSGTSMAAGVVSGVVATMIEAQRAYFGVSSSPNSIKAMLQYSAIKLPNVDQLSQGAGSVNMVGGLRLARRSNPSVGYGQWWMTSSVTPSTTIEGDTLPWSTEVVWNNHVVWGDTVFYKQSAWANHVVWGDTAFGWSTPTTEGQHVVWGDTAVWANHVVWGDSALGTTDGYHVVWGDSAVNANNVAWQPLSGVTNPTSILEIP
jgi:serine protease AprX